MKLLRRQLLHLTAGAAALSILSGHGAASQMTKTVKVVVPFAPGGTADILARLLAELPSPAMSSRRRISISRCWIDSLSRSGLHVWP